jgi:hypothetical protein
MANKGLISNFDHDQNFWDVAGTLSLVPAIAALKKADKTKGKSHSSMVMWCVALFVDQSDANRLRRMPPNDRMATIEDQVLNANGKTSSKFNWEMRQDLIDAYFNAQLTANERALSILRDKSISRADFLRKTEYTIDNARDLDTIITNSEKIFKAIAALEKLVDEEKRGGGEIKGGRRKTLQEERRI